MERAAIWQDARLRADQGVPALRSPRAGYLCGQGGRGLVL